MFQFIEFIACVEIIKNCNDFTNSSHVVLDFNNNLISSILVCHSDGVEAAARLSNFLRVEFINGNFKPRNFKVSTWDKNCCTSDSHIDTLIKSELVSKDFILLSKVGKQCHILTESVGILVG